MTLSEREERHKNLLTYNANYDLDVVQTDIVKFRPTLAHKANHAFDAANTKFCYAKHPRWLSLIHI